MADDRQRRDDLRPDRAFEVRPIVRVLDHHAVEAGRRVHARFRHRGLDNLVDARDAGRRARKAARVNDTDERARNAEQEDDATCIHRADSVRDGDFIELEAHGDRQHHRYGAAVQQRGCEFPLSNGSERCVIEERN